MTRQLVVTADDLGLSVGVNRGIRRGHRDGVITAASVLAVARECDDALAMARATPTLDVGVHLALVGEDPPVLSPREVPSLVDSRGRFPLSYRGFLRRAGSGRVDVDDVRRELDAQIQRVIAGGVQPAHLDTHQHVHLWPAVAQVVIELAQRHQVGWVRLPRAHRRGPVGAGVNILSRSLATRLRAAGLPTPGYAGLDEAGSMDRVAIGRAVAALSAGPWPVAEINVHPGEDDPSHHRFAWGYRWADELAGLLDPGTRGAAEAAGWQLVGTRRAAAGAEGSAG